MFSSASYPTTRPGSHQEGYTPNALKFFPPIISNNITPCLLFRNLYCHALLVKDGSAREGKY